MGKSWSVHFLIWLSLLKVCVFCLELKYLFVESNLKGICWFILTVTWCTVRSMYVQLHSIIKEMFYLNAQYIHYPRLTYAYPCLKSVNILCLVIKAEDLRHKPYLIHFLSKTSWIHPQNKALRHLHSMQGSSIFIKGREAGGAQRIFLFHWGGGGG